MNFWEWLACLAIPRLNHSREKWGQIARTIATKCHNNPEQLIVIAESFRAIAAYLRKIADAELDK